MDSNSSDHDELGWSWAGHEERKKMMMQLQLQFQLQLRDEFCGAYCTDYESAEDLPVPPPQFSAATATNRNSGGSMSHLIEIEKQKVGNDMAMGNWWSFTNGPSMCFSDVPISQAEAEEQGSVGAMREMIFRMAAMQPIEIDPEAAKPPKRRNVKISKDPQSVAARHRRERISHRIRILQRLVPGGTKMDTASMLDEAIHYLKFLKSQLHSLQRASSANRLSPLLMSCATPTPNSNSSYLPMHNPPSHPPHPHLHHHIN